jgi:hypothetical protein
LREAISVSSGWNSTCGNGSVSSLITLPPPFSNVSLKPPVDSSPAAYFHVIVTAVFFFCSAITCPIARPSCELVNDTRKTFAAHSGPVISSAPGVGDDQQRVVVARDLRHRKRHARVDSADEHVDLVALDELVRVIGSFRRIRFVVDREVFDLASGELAALLVDGELEAVGDRSTERGERARVRKHQADLDLA